MSPTVAKPKERQFQVVPVPAVFNRWECIDFKDTGTSPWPCPPVAIIDNNNSQQLTMNAVCVPSPLGVPSSSLASATAICSAAPIVTAAANGLPPQQQQRHEQLSMLPPPPPPILPLDSAALSSTNLSSSSSSNKIGQAMDLVKTHLTFAVREEVDILRSTISDLEGRVSLLEAENQILRQFARAEIVANLPALVQQQQQKLIAATGGNSVMTPQKIALQTVPSAPAIMDQQYQQQQQCHTARQQQPLVQQQ